MQVTATLVAAEAKQTQRGTMYTFKQSDGKSLATKDQGLAAQAQQLLNMPYVFEISEQTSNNINQHTGQPYVNRYLNGLVGPATAAPAIAAPAAPALPAATFTTGGVQVEITARDRSIWAQSASKVAVELLKYFPDAERSLKTYDTLVQREIDKYRAHHEGTGLPTPAEVATTFTAGGMVPTSVTPAAPAPGFTGDEDIPF